jgi:hypothetical protein
VPFTYQQIIDAEYQDLANEEQHAAAVLEQARLTDDVDAIKIATERIYTVDAKRNSLTARVQRMRHAAPMAGADDLSHRDVALARHYGLTAQEIGVAKGWTTDPNLSDDAKVQAYVENRQRLRQMRADGSYRDDQGVVRR